MSQLLDAEYFDGQSSRPAKAAIEITSNALTIYPEKSAAYSVRIKDVHVQPKIGSLPRVLDLPTRACLQISDHRVLEQFLPHKRDFIHVLENNKKFVVGSFVGLGVFGFFVYFVLIPFTALMLAPKFTQLFGAALTKETLAYLETTALIKKERNQKYLDRLESIRTFEAMAPYDHFEIIIYDTPTMGANAFALPSDTVIVTRQLLDLIEDDTQVLAVLLHEVGHVRNYHVMQRVIGDSVISIALFAMFGADWTSVPMVVLSTGYSRNVEKEADMFAAHHLQSHNMPPGLLADALQRLEKDSERLHGKMHRFFDYFSSHPSTQERSKYLHNFEFTNPSPQ